MSRQQQIDGTGRLQFIVLPAVGMHDRDGEISALAGQRLGLLLHGCDRWRELQVLRRRGARHVVVARAGETYPDAVEGHDRSVLEARQRLPVHIAQIGRVELELSLRHALQEGSLAEVEFVIAGHEDIRRHQVAERDNMGAVVNPRHQRGRERVAAMRQDHMAALGALGLDHRRQPGIPAAGLAVGHLLFGHQVEIVDEQEGHSRGLCRRRAGQQERDEGG